MTSKGAIILAPFGALYGALTRARTALYGSGALRVHQLGAPVLSVGNITTGGTGKTPLVAWLARAVKEREGRRVCILTRGYGRRDERQRVIVSDGEHVLADAREGGDEPLLLAEALSGVAAVISDADRVGAARWALEHLRSEVFILDDGFQHLRIARELNLLTVDATDPFGGGRLLPRGHLREPVGGIARADCIIITRAEQAFDIDGLRNELERLSGGSPPVLVSRARTSAVRPLSETAMAGAASPVVALPQPVAAFCAIGNPDAFFAHIRDDGYELAYTRAYPDHHVYSQRDADALAAHALDRGAPVLLTTAKDAVKLRALAFSLPCYVLEIELEIEDEARLHSLISEAVRKRERPA
ncbi:MAG TPA: tetraacyldisaccharide 4'-kinase [Pyrinomonadaceae bacterium]|jgi:tetraacyldisaccharide 4'-kinase|nr:tetraacyldisaccharide 4'-kinase [Pyrinomonadaceae bacterium]